MMQVTDAYVTDSHLTDFFMRLIWLTFRYIWLTESRSDESRSPATKPYIEAAK